MKNLILTTISTLMLIVGNFFLQSCQPFESEQPFDLVIANSKIIDGNGGSSYTGNLFIRGDSIAKISSSSLTNIPDSIIIDAKGKIVAPGFIDLHAHGNPFQTPDFENFTAMGVTTIVLGQDGSSPDIERLADWQKEIQENGIGVNIATFIGHGTLRELAGIGSNPRGTIEQIAKMEGLLKDNLKVCFGMSTGLEYTPGLYAEQKELMNLAKIVGAEDRMIMSHMRNEDDDQIIASMVELMQQGEHARVHISHIKSVYGKGSERADQILKILHTAQAAGINITADIYPYNASSTGIGIVFPKWSKTKEQFQTVHKTRREELLTFIRQKVSQRNGPAATLFGTSPYTGKTLADLEKEKEKPFEEILVDDIGPQGASAAYFVMNEELQTRLLQDSLVSICSDGSPTMHHPRGYGTFAKIIETYVLKQQLFSLEKAIQKMTGTAADILKLKNRGRIAVGMKADVVVFNPENVRAKATYDNPKQLSEGFDLVIINGKVARRNGQIIERNGRVLLPE